MSLRTTAICLLAIVSLASASRADMTITGFTANTNDRFTNSANFIGTGFNLSGIGQTNSGQWGTLISSNVIVSANHYAPSGSISFYSNNDPATSAVVRQITNSIRIGTSDLWLARLVAPVTNNITPFQYATQVLTAGPGINIGSGITLSDAGVFQNAGTFMTGLSATAHSNPTQDQALGTNLVSGFAHDVNFGGGKTDALMMWFDKPNTTYATQYEAHFVGGDSGAPLFVESNNQLLLAGINSFILQSTQGTVLASGSTYLGNYSSQIQHFVAISAVPEPSSLVLMAIGLGGCVWRSRRRPKIRV